MREVSLGYLRSWSGTEDPRGAIDLGGRMTTALRARVSRLGKRSRTFSRGIRSPGWNIFGTVRLTETSRPSGANREKSSHGVRLLVRGYGAEMASSSACIQETLPVLLTQIPRLFRRKRQPSFRRAVESTWGRPVVLMSSLLRISSSRYSRVVSVAIDSMNASHPRVSEN